MQGFRDYVKKKTRSVRESLNRPLAPTPRALTPMIPVQEVVAPAYQDNGAAESQGEAAAHTLPDILDSSGKQSTSHNDLDNTPSLESPPPTISALPNPSVVPTSNDQIHSTEIGQPSDHTPPADGTELMERQEAPRAEALVIHKSEITAGRDNIIYAVSGNLSIGKEEPATKSILSRLKSLLDPVSAAAFDSYEGYRERTPCFENTRIQLLADIEAWIVGGDDQAPIFVLDGIAGIGKSTVAQTVAQRASARKLLAASFFFSRNEELRKIAKYFFPTVAFQLACYNDAFAQCILDALDCEPDASQKGLPLQFSALILDPLQELLAQQNTPLLLVIDALDECDKDGGQTLLHLLTAFIPKVKGLMVLITARPEEHLRKVLNSHTGHNIFRLHDIESSIVKSDIQQYLTYHLSTIKIELLSSSDTSQWPNPDEIEQLCDLCGILFIAASTTIKFIGGSKRNPQRQLSQLLESSQSASASSQNHTAPIDTMYLHILLSAIPDHVEKDDDKWFYQYRQALGAIIVLETPLPCQTLAALLNILESDITSALSNLHSLVAPTANDAGYIFQFHHKSFPDFITSKHRLAKAEAAVKFDNCTLSQNLLIQSGDHHLQLAKACLQVMTHELHYNMAGLSQKDWYLEKSDVPSINPSIISGQLRYAALYWASHLFAVQEPDSLEDLLHIWTTKHIFMWIEVMSILGKVDICQKIIQLTVDSIKNLLKFEKYATSPIWCTLQVLFADAWRFLSKSAKIIELSPMHVYWSCLAFLPQKTLLYLPFMNLVTTRQIGLAAMWDTTLITFSGHSDAVDSVAFSPDSLKIASASRDNTIRLWDIKLGTSLATLIGHSDWVKSVAFSPDSLRLASASEDKTVQLWDAKSGAGLATLTGHSAGVTSVAFCPNDILLASASSDNTIRLWDAKSGGPLSTLTGHSDCVHSIAFSPDGLQFVSASEDMTVRLWDIKSGTVCATLTGHSGPVNSVTFSPDGSIIASASGDRTVRLWNTTPGTVFATLTDHFHQVRSIVFSPDGQQLASASWDNTVRLWDVKSGNNLASLTDHSQGVNAVAFSPDGLGLASASDDKTVRLWDAESSAGCAALVTFTGWTRKIRSVAFSPDGLKLASTSSDTTVRLWSIKSGTALAPLTGHSDHVNSVAFSPDGQRLASASKDKTVRLWDLKSGAGLASLTGHSWGVNSVVFSPDGCELASASSDNTVQLWDVESSAHLATFIGHSRWVDLVAFSPDGQVLASASADKTVRLWNTKSGAPLATFTGQYGPVNSFAFSPNDLQLASASSDGIVRIWDCYTGNLLNAPSRTYLDFKYLSVIPSHLEVLFDTLFHYQQSSNPEITSHLVTPPSVSFLLLVQHKVANIYGLVAAKSQPANDWELVPFCWFPPHIQPSCFSVDYASSTIAVGCEDGQVFWLDFTPRFTGGLLFLKSK